MSILMIYQGLGVAMACNTLLFIHKANATGRYSPLFRFGVLALPQLWMFLSSLHNTMGQNSTFPKWLSNFMMEDVVRPSEGGPLSMIAFVAVYGVVRFTDGQ